MEKTPNKTPQDTTTIKLYQWVSQYANNSGDYAGPELYYLPMAPAATGAVFEKAIQDAYTAGLDSPFDYTTHSDGSYSVYITQGTGPYGLRWWVEHTGSALRPLSEQTPPQATNLPAGAVPNHATIPSSTHGNTPRGEVHITVHYPAPNGFIIKKAYTSTQPLNDILRTLRSGRARTILPTLEKAEEQMFQPGVTLHFADRINTETLNDALGETLHPLF